jgi:putative CocE/NonD family hydrolase
MNKKHFRRTRFAFLVVLGVGVFLTTACGERVRSPTAPTDYQGFDYTSRYVTMRDGVRIAVDLYLPKGLKPGQKLPTILDQARYGRAMELRPPFSWLPMPAFLAEHATPEFALLFVAHGYAWVEIDVRGSGASFGSVPFSWSPDEVKDGAEIVDWIIRQPWSNGKVGATGVSYAGESAEFLLANRHPAVKAIAPRFALWDTYNDIAFPGGVYQSWLLPRWSYITKMLDRNDTSWLGQISWFIPYLIRGIRPVDEDQDRKLLTEAVASHHNGEMTKLSEGAVFRDDLSPSALALVSGFGERITKQVEQAGGTNLNNPAFHAQEIEASGAAVFGIDGWYDGAYCRGAIARYANLRNPHKLLIGPWVHDSFTNVATGEKFDAGPEILRFFDYWLKEIQNGVMDEPSIKYFTMGEERWRTATQWPPSTSTRSYYLSSGNRLLPSAPVERQASDLYRADYSVGTGRHTRWEPVLGTDETGGSSKLNYGNRTQVDRKLIAYDSLALKGNTEVTGSPIVTLYMSSSAVDGIVFAYLEDVDPKGNVAYVSEGEFRAVHRRLDAQRAPYYATCPCHTFLKNNGEQLVPNAVVQLSFDLLPTSYLFRQGHSIRLAVAAADRDHFSMAPASPPILQFERNSKYASKVDLPLK